MIAQLVEHRTDIAEVMGSNPFQVSDIFLGFPCNCFSCLITPKITFTRQYSLSAVHIYDVCHKQQKQKQQQHYVTINTK